MTGRYDTTDNKEARFEPGSGDRLLANKLGISDPREIDNTKSNLWDRHYEDGVNLAAVDQPISIADLYERHRRWLGRVYVWPAGTGRST